MENKQRIALLIDADNVSQKYVKLILDEVSNHGSATIKRAYADWTSTSKSKWKSTMLECSITPIQQYAYTKGKNSSDSALIIDAMDILYSDNVDAFCIVSSDSDFIKLSQRLREAGKYVLGMGENKTNEHFIKSCDRFIYLESLENHVETNPEIKPRNVTSLDGKSKDDLVFVIKNAIEETSEHDGVANLADVGNYIFSRFPEFDSRNYGFKKLSSLVDSKYYKAYFELKTNEKQVRFIKMK